MLKKGNGAPRRCVMNLLATRRGEVWFDRLCGLPDRIDDPGYSAAANAENHDPCIDKVTSGEEIVILFILISHC